jgi:hypothetical protein
MTIDVVFQQSTRKREYRRYPHRRADLAIADRKIFAKLKGKTHLREIVRSEKFVHAPVE